MCFRCAHVLRRAAQAGAEALLQLERVEGDRRPLPQRGRNESTIRRRYRETGVEQDTCSLSPALTGSVSAPGSPAVRERRSPSPWAPRRTARTAPRRRRGRTGARADQMGEGKVCSIERSNGRECGRGSEVRVRVTAGEEKHGFAAGGEQRPQRAAQARRRPEPRRRAARHGAATQQARSRAVAAQQSSSVDTHMHSFIASAYAKRASQLNSARPRAPASWVRAIRQKGSLTCCSLCCALRGAGG